MPPAAIKPKSDRATVGATAPLVDLSRLFDGQTWIEPLPAYRPPEPPPPPPDPPPVPEVVLIVAGFFTLSVR